jgi:hypothetical protein
VLIGFMSGLFFTLIWIHNWIGQIFMNNRVHRCLQVAILHEHESIVLIALSTHSLLLSSFMTFYHTCCLKPQLQMPWGITDVALSFRSLHLHLAVDLIPTSSYWLLSIWKNV